MSLTLVAAVGLNDIIGDGGRLPWYLPEDLRQFKMMTTGSVVLLGRVTYGSILERLGGPLPDRDTVVLTRQPESITAAPHVQTATSVSEALSIAQATRGRTSKGLVFVAGGASLYRQLLPYVVDVRLTAVEASPEGDARMPTGWRAAFAWQHSSEVLRSREGGQEFRYEYYRRCARVGPAVQLRE